MTTPIKRTCALTGKDIFSQTTPLENCSKSTECTGQSFAMIKKEGRLFHLNIALFDSSNTHFQVNKFSAVLSDEAGLHYNSPPRFSRILNV